MRYLILAFLVLPQLLVAQSPAPAGFAASSVEAQTRAERAFVDTVTPAAARRWLAALTEEPHVAGTAAEKKLADYVLARFKEFGLAAELVLYDVLLNHPKHVSLKLVSPVEEELALREAPFDVDKDSTDEGMFPAYVPKIPSLPIAYAEAEKILRHLGGPVVPAEWQGGLPFAYHIGPGAARVAMDVQMDEGLKPIYNVIATITGSVEPEKKVILGNHRDAWTHGAVDPNSGSAAQLEVARALAAALKTGWRPKRTIILASWDAEEYGLVGSTEWAEEHAADLQKNAVAYLNGDAVVTGPNLNMSGSPSLLALAMSAASDVSDPRTGKSVGAGWEARQRTS